MTDTQIRGDADAPAPSGGPTPLKHAAPERLDQSLAALCRQAWDAETGNSLAVLLSLISPAMMAEIQERAVRAYLMQALTNARTADVRSARETARVAPPRAAFDQAAAAMLYNSELLGDTRLSNGRRLREAEPGEVAEDAARAWKTGRSLIGRAFFLQRVAEEAQRAGAQTIGEALDETRLRALSLEGDDYAAQHLSEGEE